MSAQGIFHFVHERRCRNDFEGGRVHTIETTGISPGRQMVVAIDNGLDGGFDVVIKGSHGKVLF